METIVKNTAEKIAEKQVTGEHIIAAPMPSGFSFVVLLRTTRLCLSRASRSNDKIPLIGSLAGIDLSGIHWVIVGGESGFGARPMKIQWIREIFRLCRKAHVPFFFKQWGGVRKDLTGRQLGGRTYNEMPARIAA